MEQIDIAVVGAGVVGLAIASEVARDGREVFVFEKKRTFGQETSDRNSEVIHAGLYYKKDTLKAKLCVEGKRLIYQIDKDRVDHRKVGKLIVAVDDTETLVLEDIFETAILNDVSDLRILDSEEIRSMEPNIRAVAAIYSPSTGIINTHQLMKYFIARAKDASGGIEPLLYETQVIGIKKQNTGYRIVTKNPQGTEESIEAKILINSAGLDSAEIAKMAGIDIDAAGYGLYFCKGEYFSVSSRHKDKIGRLIYPTPEQAGLGIHANIDLAGEIKLGPNAVYMPDNIIDYSIDETHQKEFYNSAKKFLPFLDFADLHPDQAGIRPKLFGPGMPERDFVIREESDRGLPGMINLVGIESPGLTAAPAIGKYVGQIVDDVLKQ